MISPRRSRGPPPNMVGFGDITPMQGGGMSPRSGNVADRSTSPSQRDLFKEHRFAVNLPILDLTDVEAKGAVSRLPPINLNFPRGATPADGTPRSVQSGFVAKANQAGKINLKILDSSRIDRFEESHDEQNAGRRGRKRGTHAAIASDLARAGLAGLLGTNEEHANEFDDSYAGLVAKMNVRSDPIDNGGTGLWSEADFARIKVERSQAAASTRQPKPPRGAKKGGGEYEFKSPRMSLMERYVKAAGPATERNVVSKEIAEKLERLRSDQRELASFDMHVDELLRSRNKRSVDGPNFPKVNCTPDAIELYSPRSMAHRLAERSEVLSARMAAAQQKAHEAADRRLHEHEEMLNRHERMVARREAQRSREILLRRQSGWVMILALTARAKILEQRIEPERRRRLEDSVARRLQKTYRIQKLRRRLAALAASRRALTKLVWVLRLKLARRRKYTASNKILAFLRGVKGGGTLVMSIRAFSYRVMTTQRLWRKKALMHAAQVELLTLQARREEEKVLREEMMDRHAHGGAASPTPHVDESGEGGEGGEDGLEIVRHEVSMVMPLPESLERVPEEFVREAVSEYLQERRRQRAVILHEYRVALAAHEEFENFNKVLREGVAQSMGDGIHFGITPIAFGGGEIPETLDGYEACVILWRIVNLQRRWRKTHPRTKRPAPPERTETKLAMLSGGANKPEQSIMARSILLQKDAGGRPHAPFLPLTLSKDELGDVLAAAKRLAKKSG